jgi:DNA processing protein
VSVDLPDEAHLIALSTLPKMGPAALRTALDGRTPAEAWNEHRHEAVVPTDPEQLWHRHLAAGVTVLGPAHPEFAAAFDDDPAPPFLLFCMGDLSALGHRAAGVVGTRRATAYGRGVARRLGACLGQAGVAVVSGLAKGIDGVAHRGVLDAGRAPAIGVVATGLDVIYPRVHRRLWEEVGATGLLVSEAPLGTPPERWRFPARNRIIAALSELVIVVESARRGGSLYTVEEAVKRDRPVLAVPGPITSPVSFGTNRLIGDGAQPVCDDTDVLLALGLASGSGDNGVPEPGGRAGRVLDATAWEVVTLDTLARRTGLTLPELAASIDELCRGGWLIDHGGSYERSVP